MQTFVGSKEKQLVSQESKSRTTLAELWRVNRTSDVKAATEEVATRHEIRRTRIAINAGVLLDGIQSIQITITPEGISCSVKIVRARLGNGNEVSAIRTSKLRRKLILQQSELRNFFWRDVTLRTSDGFVIVVNAINYEIIIAWTLASD